MKLKVLQLRDLAMYLDRVPQRELPATADVRKCVGAVEAIRKVIQEDADKYEVLYAEAADINKPNIEKIKELRGDMTDEEANKDEELQAFVAEANRQLEPVNEKIAALDAEMREKDVEIELSDEHKAFIKAHWEKFIRPQFVNAKDMLEVAEALNI